MDDSLSATHTSMRILPNPLYYIIYNNGLFYAVGNSGTIIKSSDGISWSSINSGTTGHLRGIHYGNGIFVAIGSSGTIITSSDATSWTSSTSGTSEYLRGVTSKE